VNKIPTSCFQFYVFRLKKLNFNDIGLVLNMISKQKTCYGKSQMTTIIEIEISQSSVLAVDWRSTIKDLFFAKDRPAIYRSSSNLFA